MQEVVRSRGGLEVHKCRREKVVEEVVEDAAAGGAGEGISHRCVECR